MGHRKWKGGTVYERGTAANTSPDLSSFIGSYLREPPEELQLYYKPLQGGLCADVTRVVVRFLNPVRHPRTQAVVVKRVSGIHAREFYAYTKLKLPEQIAPKLHGAQLTDEGAILYLEWIHSSGDWPWKHMSESARVLQRLAALHTRLPIADMPAELLAWDYEAELRESARATYEALDTLPREPRFARFRRALGVLRRITESLACLRRQLLAEFPSIIHGDAHSGNLRFRREGHRRSPVLLDWGRTRRGSALEDVCSWLHSLALWEPEARRRHDSLVRGYLAEMDCARGLTRELRDACWLASASNGLAGALRYYLGEMRAAPEGSDSYGIAAWGAAHWLRIISRADACFRA
jgi:hypothetical protein